jgi:HAD superfamily hydrolase (TIGR01490 family)
MSIHIFDVDYTLVRKSTSYYFLLQGLSEGIFSMRQLIRLPYEWLKYELGFVDPNFIKNSIRFLIGTEKTCLESLVERAFELRIKKNIFVDGAQKIKEIKARGEDVFFATSAFYSLIRPLEEFLGVKETIASHLEFADGKIAGISGAAAFGHGKKDAVTAWLVQKGISPQDVCFYSDSYSDIPLMELCGRVVAVNPDRFLRKAAKKHGWEVVRFKQTLGEA